MRALINFFVFNYQEILINLIGAFFGFLFALIVEYVFKLREDKTTYKKVRNGILEELATIKNELSTIGGHPDYLRYSYIVWNMCINSGYLFSVSGKPIYDSFVDIYKEIVFANEIEKEFFLLKTQNNVSIEAMKAIEALDKNRRENFNNILLKISKLNYGKEKK